MTGEEKRRFDVKATDVGGGDASETGAEARSVRALISRFREKGLQVSEVRGRGLRGLFEPREAGAEEFAIFNAELAAACKRGVPLPGALRALSREMGGRRLRRALGEVAGDIEGGRGLGEALAARTGIFPPAYVALVEAGLASGNLAGTLLLFAEEARLGARVRRSTMNALAYPLLVLFAASGLLAVLGWVVLPAWEQIYAELQIREGLPSLTQLIMSSAPALRWAPPILLALLAALAAGWRLVAFHAAGARFLGALRLKLPVAGGFCRALALSRFCRTLAGALKSGVPVPESVALAGLATGNAAIEAAAEETSAAVREGEKLSDGLEVYGNFFPATLAWMVSLGESRGEVLPALEDYARLQEEAAGRMGASLPMLVGSVVTLCASIMLGFCVLSLMLPLFSWTSCL